DAARLGADSIARLGAHRHHRHARGAVRDGARRLRVGDRRRQVVSVAVGAARGVRVGALGGGGAGADGRGGAGRRGAGGGLPTVGNGVAGGGGRVRPAALVRASRRVSGSGQGGGRADPARAEAGGGGDAALGVGGRLRVVRGRGAAGAVAGRVEAAKLVSVRG